MFGLIATASALAFHSFTLMHGSALNDDCMFVIHLMVLLGFSWHSSSLLCFGKSRTAYASQTPCTSSYTQVTLWHRYDEAIMAAAQGNTELALQQFQDATEVAQQQQDKQLETMAATAVGLLLTSAGQNAQQQEVGWKVLQQ